MRKEIYSGKKSNRSISNLLSTMEIETASVIRILSQLKHLIIIEQMSLRVTLRLIYEKVETNEVTVGEEKEYSLHDFSGTIVSEQRGAGTVLVFSHATGSGGMKLLKSPASRKNARFRGGDLSPLADTSTHVARFFIVHNPPREAWRCLGRRERVMNAVNPGEKCLLGKRCLQVKMKLDRKLPGNETKPLLFGRLDFLFRRTSWKLGLDILDWIRMQTGLILGDTRNTQGA